MIGKQEWNEMAQQVHALEKRMESFYRKLAGQINDPELQKTFTQLSLDEEQHGAIINDLAEKVLKS